MPRPFFMNADDKARSQTARGSVFTIGPPSADRFRNLRVWVLVFAAAASVASLYFFFSG